jgi:uncharacterized membrane protein YfcA
VDYVLICAAALFASALTLFSGFGLGAILMPFFAIFFPVEVAIGATAIVHTANNFFKLVLVGKHAVWKVVALFAIPGAALAFLGAWLLTKLAAIAPFASYTLGGREYHITLINLVVAVLIAFFALFELHPYFVRLEFGRKWVPFGGALSGFFGGLSGHQGALRAAFLTKIGLGAEEYIGTSVASSTLVDVARMTVYGITYFTGHFIASGPRPITGLIIAGCLAAFVGAFLGSRYTKKVTTHAIHLLVGIMLILLALALGSGLI